MKIGRTLLVAFAIIMVVNAEYKSVWWNDNNMEPSTIDVGTKMNWFRNSDDTNKHTILIKNSQGENIGQYSLEQTASHTFNSAGEYTYSTLENPSAVFHLTVIPPTPFYPNGKTPVQMAQDQENIIANDRWIQNRITQRLNLYNLQQQDEAQAKLPGAQPRVGPFPNIPPTALGQDAGLTNPNFDTKIPPATQQQNNNQNQQQQQNNQNQQQQNSNQNRPNQQTPQTPQTPQIPQTPQTPPIPPAEDGGKVRGSPRGDKNGPAADNKPAGDLAGNNAANNAATDDTAATKDNNKEGSATMVAINISLLIVSLVVCLF